MSKLNNGKPILFSEISKENESLASHSPRAEMVEDKMWSIFLLSVTNHFDDDYDHDDANNDDDDDDDDDRRLSEKYKHNGDRTKFGMFSEQTNKYLECGDRSFKAPSGDTVLERRFKCLLRHDVCSLLSQSSIAFSCVKTMKYK
jgi:hypothetical protein